MIPKLSSIDSIYLPVKNKEHSMAWYVNHFGLEIEGDHLKIGQVEVFFLETLSENQLTFTTKDWKQGEDYYQMPAFCFRTNDIEQLYKELKENDVEIEDLIAHSWFKEFDLFDCDRNKLKIWQPL